MARTCFLGNICLQWLNVTDIFVPSGMALTAGLGRELLGLSLPCEESWASGIFVAVSLIDHLNSICLRTFQKMEMCVFHSVSIVYRCAVGALCGDDDCATNVCLLRDANSHNTTWTLFALRFTFVLPSNYSRKATFTSPAPCSSSLRRTVG